MVKLKEEATKNVSSLFGLAGVLVAGMVMLVAVIGLTILGVYGQIGDAVTALASIGGAVAGGFAGWMLRGTVDDDNES